MSEIARRRIAALLLIAGVIVAVLALADIGPFEDPPTEEERVREAVDEFFAAAAAGDGETFCALLTRDARRSLELNTAQQLRLDEPPKCPDVLTLLGPVFEGSSIDVRLVSVSGPQARAETRFKLKDAGAQPRTVLLVDQDGEWLVSDPG
jgi:hypothetical protein